MPQPFGAGLPPLGVSSYDAQKALPEHYLITDGLLKNQIPTIIVITKHGFHPEFVSEASDIFNAAGVIVSAFVPVRAEPIMGQPITGLKELVNETSRLLEGDAIRRAFAAAQQVNLDLKIDACRVQVLAAATAAGAAAAIPLPFADAIALVPIQVAMIVALSSIFNVKVEEGAALPFATSIVGCLATTVAGRMIVGELLKFVPFAGTPVNAVIAATLTRTFGNCYTDFLSTMSKGGAKTPSLADIVDQFPDFWRSRGVVEE